MVTAEGLAGFGYQQLTMDLRDRSDRNHHSDESLDRFLLTAGARITFRPVPVLGVYGQAGYGALLMVPGTHGDAEVGLRLERVPGLAVHGGWRYWREYMYIGPVAEYVILSFDGLVFGVHITI